ncbi:MAG: ATP-binding protein [Maricaulaceae bacterium]
MAAFLEVATFFITVSAMAFAVAALVWAWRITERARGASRKWRARAERLEARLARADSIFGAHPGLVLVWDDDARVSAGDWGQPRIYGAPLALASLMQFCETPDGPEPGKRLLDAIGDFEARDAAGQDTTLRERLTRLRTEGLPFSLTVIGPSGRFLEADGRPAGASVVLWLSDSTVKGLEESGARGRVEAAKQLAGQDPLAVFDLLGKAPFPVWRLSANLKLLWANEAYLEAVEARALEEAVRKNLHFDGETETQARVARDERARAEAVRWVVAQGQRRAFRIITFPVSGGVAGMALDVTQVEDLADELNRRQHAHDETLDHLADAVAIFDSQAKLIFHNTAFTKLFGLDEGWLDEGPNHGAVLDRLRDLRRLPEQTDYAGWKRKELARYASEETMEDELWPLPDGRTLRLARLRHPFGGLLLIFEDMTDQITLRAQYNTLINVQRATLDKLNEGVAVFGTDGRLRLANTAFASLWRLDREALAEGAAFDDLLTQCLPLYPDEAFWGQIKARLTDTDPAAREQVSEEIRRTDDTILTYLSRPLPDGATVIAWNDVTDSRRIQKALQDRAEALEEADQAKTSFMERVSLHLRAPLTTIRGYSEFLTAPVGDPLSARQREQVGAIHDASLQLSKLIDDILDMSAIEAGKLELELGDVALAELLESVAGLAATSTQDTQVSLTIDCDPEIPVIRGDHRRLRQALSNLVSNALRHTPAGGSVTLGARVEETETRLWVADDGPGMSREDQTRAFDRFESGARGGPGLGLTLVRAFAQLHGGWVELESAPDAGTQVTIHLPLEPSLRAAHPELSLGGLDIPPPVLAAGE